MRLRQALERPSPESTRVRALRASARAFRGRAAAAACGGASSLGRHAGYWKIKASSAAPCFYKDLGLQQVGS